MTRSLILVFALLATTSTTSVTAQVVVTPQGVGGYSGYSGYRFSYKDSWSSVVQSPQVQVELELVEDQIKKLRAASDEFYKAQSELYRTMSKEMKDELGRAEFAERVAALREEMYKKIQETLLPHQLERAKQVAFQMRVRNGSSYSLYADSGIRELLGITEEQQKRLQERSKALNQELTEKYQQLRQEMADELLKELTAEQRKKLKELAGEDYTPPQIDWKKYYEQRRGNASQSKKDGETK
ncbi:MAG: hypothetical protein KDB14_23905 [Planctomycetales bacterium]|nr:hypothetical protein [Planctomycetales bacterium]